MTEEKSDPNGIRTRVGSDPAAPTGGQPSPIVEPTDSTGTTSLPPPHCLWQDSDGSINFEWAEPSLILTLGCPESGTYLLYDGGGDTSEDGRDPLLLLLEKLNAARTTLAHEKLALPHADPALLSEARRYLRHAPHHYDCDIGPHSLACTCGLRSARRALGASHD